MPRSALRHPTPWNARRRGVLGVAALAAAGLLSACQPVPGNLTDTTPPSIVFRYNGVIVPNGTTKVVTSAAQLTILGRDSGGMESIETALENRFTCSLGGSHSNQVDTNPMSLKGFRYSMDDQVYVAHRTAPDGFWPDVNGNGINDPSEHHMRFDELLVIDSAGLVGQSLSAYSLGEECTMPGGATGTITASSVVVTAEARNTRSEIGSAPLSQKRRIASITLQMST